MLPIEVTAKASQRGDYVRPALRCESGVGVVNHHRVLDAYRLAWNSRDEADVRVHLERCWTPHSVYANPFVDPVT
ncbi:MAG TPA: hypothetical protein VHN80_18645, partial [Kineosporiaceae bacterium]|nr:hypothetical protein [Kineosporiaceae bacterium]